MLLCCFVVVLYKCTVWVLGQGNLLGLLQLCYIQMQFVHSIMEIHQQWSLVNGWRLVCMYSYRDPEGMPLQLKWLHIFQLPQDIFFACSAILEGSIRHFIQMICVLIYENSTYWCILKSRVDEIFSIRHYKNLVHKMYLIKTLY